MGIRYGDPDDYKGPHVAPVLPGSLGDHTLIVGDAGSGAMLWAREQRARLAGRDVDACQGEAAYYYRVSGLEDAWNAMHRLEGLECWRVPFRAPHWTCSLGSLSGSVIKGWRLRPGEVSLAHGGILLLDSLQEWPAASLELIASVARTQTVALRWGQGETKCTISVPARFRIIATATECPCGRRDERCKCTTAQVTRHRQRMAAIASICREVPKAEWQGEVKAMRAALSSQQ